MSIDLSSSWGVRAQFALWGYAITGEITERSAIIAEAREVAVIYSGAWDSAAADLDGWMVSKGDGTYRRIRDWAALPWATEHMLRGHESLGQDCDPVPLADVPGDEDEAGHDRGETPHGDAKRQPQGETVP